jgi:hypothetical protein
MTKTKAELTPIGTISELQKNMKTEELLCGHAPVSNHSNNLFLKQRLKEQNN